MAEQQPKLNSIEEPSVLPSKRKQTAEDADAESTKKRQVESCADEDASAAVSGGVEIDGKGKGILNIGKGILNVDMDKKIVTVNMGKGLIEADMDKGMVKVGIGKRITKFDLGEGKLIEEDDPYHVDHDGLMESDEDDEFAIRLRFPRAPLH